MLLIYDFLFYIKEITAQLGIPEYINLYRSAGVT